MIILISPAKKMRYVDYIVKNTTTPLFIDETNKLVRQMQKLSADDLKSIFKCSDKIALKSYELYQNFDKLLTSPAILSYDGIQYSYMHAHVFQEAEYQFLQSHLYIISGLYGLLRPLDEIKPHRLDFGISYKTDSFDSIYDFWSNKLHDFLYQNHETIVNLSSKEYSKVIMDHLTNKDCFITITFFEQENGKLLEKGVYCKMARGSMVRFIVENKIDDPLKLKEFNGLGYKFSEKLSTNNHYIFIRYLGL